MKYAHEKLDNRHVQEKTFDKLTFSLLVAGELEIASLDSTPLNERVACINIAKTICYHRKYLKDDELRAG